jgi:probable F420-dependent oxidoreductase
MKYWIMLSQFEQLENYVPLAQLVEECGYAGVLIPDHLVLPAHFDTRHPIGHPTDPEDIWPDPLSMVIAMSQATRRIEFATFVYVLPLREPFPVAKQVATTAMLSGYRFRFGMGVGWLHDEFELMGSPFHQRGRKADEMIDILYDLWDDGYAEHHGQHYDFSRVGMFPVPKEKIPIWVGGKTEAAMKRAARCDGAMPMSTTVEEARGHLTVLGAERKRLGKDPLDGRGLITIQDMAELPDYRALEADGATDALVFPWTTIIPPEVANKPPRERLPELEAFARQLGL